MKDLHTPVLIVGGGPAGLVMSLLLREFGVEALVIERRDGMPALPKAHIINQRSVEILHEAGVGAALRAVGSPHENMVSVAWYTSFAGPAPLHARELGRVDAWGGGAQLAEHQAASPYYTTNLAQMKLEPILLARLREVAPDAILLNHEVTTFEDHGDGVRARVVDCATGEEFSVDADYLVGADGGRTVGDVLGIELLGQRDLVRMVSAHITADLSAVNPDPGASMYWFVNPDKGASLDSGNLVKIGGRGWGADSDEWVFNLGKQVDDPVEIGEDYFVDHVRRALNLPELDVTVHRVSQWNIESVIATSFSRGRVHLIGDAAHRNPPTGGLGLNGGIADAHNLAWKLALVLAGKAGTSLLDTYEAERKPVVIRNAEQSLESFAQISLVDEALGLDRELTAEQRWAQVAELFSDSDEGRVMRKRVDAATAARRHEFMAQNLQIGYSYESGALVPDGSALRVGADDVTDYVATTRPGHRVPHAWVERGGMVTSTFVLGRSGRFLLIVGTEGEIWRGAAARLAPAIVDVVGIGAGQEWTDRDGAWAAQREVSESGAVLVRPDQHVAWRAEDAVPDPAAVLADVLRTVLF